jgi:plasmid stabilization system protein ParE
VKLVFMPTAAADLERIGDWIAEDNPARAVSFVRELRMVCSVLPELPRAFPMVPRYEMKGVRRISHGQYLIFYRVTEEQVEVVHVVSGARDYEPILFPEA